MTADEAGVRALLDQLDDARGRAALGPLRVGEHYGIHLYVGEKPVGTTLLATDAAVLVAEHNATPALVAALRAVLELADEYDRTVAGLTLDGVAMRPLYHGGVVCSRIRSVVTAALEAR